MTTIPLDWMILVATQSNHKCVAASSGQLSEILVLQGHRHVVQGHRHVVHHLPVLAAHVVLGVVRDDAAYQNCGQGVMVAAR